MRELLKDALLFELMEELHTLRSCYPREGVIPPLMKESSAEAYEAWCVLKKTNPVGPLRHGDKDDRNYNQIKALSKVGLVELDKEI